MNPVLIGHCIPGAHCTHVYVQQYLLPRFKKESNENNLITVKM